MTISKIRWVAIAVAVAIIVLGYLSLSRTVTVLADGRSFTVTTRALTVRGAIAEAGLVLRHNDKVEPGPFSLLRNGLVIDLQRAAVVSLTVDGHTITYISAERDPTKLLAAASVTLGENDLLLLAGQPFYVEEDLPYASALSLAVRRPISISVNDNGELIQFQSSALTVGHALMDQGLSLSAGDRVDPSIETALNEPIAITIVRARPIAITIEEGTVSISSAANTVGEALAEAGVSLQGLDHSDPAEDQPVPADGEIRVVRVVESVALEQVTIPHEIEWQPDDEAELDSVSVIQLGQDGVSASRVRVRYQDGEEVAREEEAERVLVQPLSQINGYGTKIVIRTIVVDGVTIEYYRAVQVFTTWYSPCNSGVDGCLYGTSAGIPLEHGVIATYLNWYRELKFATVYVPGYGPGTIADVGSYTPDPSRPWIDLAFSESEPHTWVNAWVTIYFTTPVPAYIPPIWPP